jgi:hypothetical protein
MIRHPVQSSELARLGFSSLIGDNDVRFMAGELESAELNAWHEPDASNDYPPVRVLRVQRRNITNIFYSVVIKTSVEISFEQYKICDTTLRAELTDRGF